MSIKSKFKGSKCGVCKKEINIGQEIENYKNTWCHVTCIPTKEKPAETKPTEPKKEKTPGEKPKVKEFVKVDSPSTEAEILVRYHLDRAHKIVYEHIESFDTLSRDDLYSLRVKEGMVTKLLVDADLKLRQINGIKSKYE